VKTVGCVNFHVRQYTTVLTKLFKIH
jgi:hypothetical protein